MYVWEYCFSAHWMCLHCSHSSGSERSHLYVVFWIIPWTLKTKYLISIFSGGMVQLYLYSCLYLHLYRAGQPNYQPNYLNSISSGGMVASQNFTSATCSHTWKALSRDSLRQQVSVWHSWSLMRLPRLNRATKVHNGNHTWKARSRDSLRQRFSQLWKKLSWQELLEHTSQVQKTHQVSTFYNMTSLTWPPQYQSGWMMDPWNFKN